jgi:hypothetical protein
MNGRFLAIMPVAAALAFVLLLIILAGALDTAGLPPELWP